jgi:hypothetical protein
MSIIPSGKHPEILHQPARPDCQAVHLQQAFQPLRQHSVGEGVHVLPPLSSLSSVSFTDRLGLALSGLCLVHCLLLPLVLPLLTVASDVAEHPFVHIGLAMLIFPTTLWSAWHGYKHHGRRSIPTLLMCGALVITLAALFGEQMETLAAYLSHEALEAVLTSIGSVMLVAGHWKNWRHSDACGSNCIHHQ